MSPRRARLAGALGRAALAAALALSAAAPALADTPTTRWDRAKDPAAARRWELHASVRERMQPHRGGGEAAARSRRARIEEARDDLEAADAEKSADVRLRFDLGEVYALLDMHERAAEVLSAALAAEPDHPAAIDAWFHLAMAEARLGHHAKERDAHVAYLARASRDPSRILVTLSNLAESEMHLGNLDEAVARWDECLKLAGTLPNVFDAHTTVALAEYGLAIAHDRRRDPVASFEHAKNAVSLDPSGRIISDGDGVFFVPAYERSWYVALVHMVHARKARDPRVAAMHFGAAERLWDDYVQGGRRAAPPDRWARLAAQHRDEAREEKVAAQKRPPPAGLPRTPNEVPTWGLPY